MSILCDNCGKSDRLHFCYGEGNLDCYFHSSEQSDHLQPEGLEREIRDLKSLVEDYQKAVDDSGRHHLIAPENVQFKFNRLQDALRSAVKWNEEYKRLNDLSGDPYWVHLADEALQ